MIARPTQFAAVLSAAFALGAPDPARAGPWTRAPGEGFASVEVRYFTTSHTAPSGAGFAKPTLAAYGEWGWRDWLTFGAEADGALGMPAAGRDSAEGGARAFARVRLLTRQGGDVISGEASLGARREGGRDLLESRLSLLYGQGFSWGWYDMAATLKLDGARPAETVTEATLGWRPSAGWLLYGQLTATTRLRPDFGEDVTALKAGLFGGREIAAGRTMVIGARHDFLTKLQAPGLEVSAAIWLDF